ncbi:hypothetical protein [Kutzneria buriramensis]|uniref:Secreted protein n=1 Tax=Kutzneria buriramensis TaxID=1045776 RepID=A0A3E0IB09_9PSEU|nr:hypothetical protein [Kutzneria buriramensis]REH55736.1 hypothetical protein BCF44_101762 [Kutzneria buriramensis]
MFRKMIVGGVAAAAALTAFAPVALAADNDKPTVQLNAGSNVNVYQFTGGNTAFGNCPNGKGVFSSPALVFSDYQYGPTDHYHGNVAARATLKPGLPVTPGTWPLFMTCGDKEVDAVFTVPAQTTPPPTTTTTPPAQKQQTVQLNADTAALPGRTNVYQYTEGNVAFGYCPDNVKGVFFSPALFFSNYGYTPTNHYDGNVAATATLRPGTSAGTYYLALTCGDKTVTTNFTVPAKQVTKTPVGAPQTGGGATATVVE